MFNNEQIIRDELELLKQELTDAYAKSGKKTTGEWQTGLDILATETKGILKGFGYLAGRKAGKMPPVQRILKWVKTRGIQPYIASMTQSQLAYAIAYNIGQNGTNEINHLKIYDKIVTPERMQKILDKVSVVNLQAFITEITAHIQLLTKDL